MDPRLLKRVVAPGDYVDDEETLDAYSYDASGEEARPALVLRPSSEEQLRRILIHANQIRAPVVPRGNGTGIRGGTVKEQAIILDLRHLSRIAQLDTRHETVIVEAGVTIRALNEALEKYNYYFPLIPENDLATIGGLASQNHITEESYLFGDYTKVVVEAECFDGLGRHHVLHGNRLTKAIGQEGTTLLFTRLKLRVTKLNHKLTAELFKPKDAADAVRLVAKARETRPLWIEYLDPCCSKLLGLPEEKHLLIIHPNDEGSYKERGYVETLMVKRKELASRLLMDAPYEEEATLSDEQAVNFIELCEKERITCYGHLGSGVLISALAKRNQIERMRNSIVALGALPAGKHGYGRTKKAHLPAAVRSQAIKLREEWNYNGTLNPGVRE